MTTDEYDISERFIKFIYEETQFSRRFGKMPETEAARFVVDICFASMLQVWETAYGHKRLAEDFYQLADRMVDKSNESGT